MQPNAIMQRQSMAGSGWAAPPQRPWLPRLVGKFALDILPAALTSVIGGLLVTHYQFGHQASPRPVAEREEPASAEMMAMVRDEHAAIINYLNGQIAAERSRNIADDAAAADARAADRAVAAYAAPQHGAAAVAVKTTVAVRTARDKAPAAAVAPPAHAPLVIAQAQQYSNGGAAFADRLARDPDSLLAKTLDIKDHVVAATRSVVTAIGNVFASVGERIGGALPGGRSFTSAS